MRERILKLAFVLSLPIWGLVGICSAREHPAEPAFKYIGGTTELPEHCKGKLELSSQDLIFECPHGSLAIPYDSIRLMEYRPNISRKVRRMKPRWKVKPDVISPLFGRKGNRYFTIVYTEPESSVTNALVLEVSPDAMRPYLAEIDLRVGYRVEVESFEDYD